MSELKTNGGLFTSGSLDWFHANGGPAKLAKLKKHFVAMLTAMIKFEREACKKELVQPNFTIESSKKVAKLLERVSDHYELEALRRCIFDLNIIPDSYDEIKKAAEVIRNS